MFKLFKKLTMHTDNTPTVATDNSTPVEQYPLTPEEAFAGDPASTPPESEPARPEPSTQTVPARLKELAKHYPCVSTKQVEGGVELYLFTQTKVPHPTFVETIRQKLADNENVGDNHIYTGATIEEILDNIFNLKQFKS
jgi:hypothetical protein